MVDGSPQRLGELFDRNHLLLRKIGVSTPLLDELVAVARKAGASGAKLSGGGGGGNIIALVTEESAEQVERALLHAGARRVIITKVGTS